MVPQNHSTGLVKHTEATCNIIAFDKGEHILILPLLAGSGLMLSSTSCNRGVLLTNQLRFSTSSVWLFFGGERKFADLF